MSEKITKATFVSMIAERLDLSKQKSNETVDAIFEEIANQLKQGKSITLPSFGTLSVKERAARTGRNPATGAAMNIPASKVPHFKAGKELKEAVNC